MNLEVGYIERFTKGLVTNYFDGSYTLFLLVAFVCFAIISVSIYLLVANHFAKKNNMSLWKYIRKMESESNNKIQYHDITDSGGVIFLNAGDCVKRADCIYIGNHHFNIHNNND